MKKVYTITQAAEVLGVPRRTLYSYIKAGYVPVEQVSSNRIVMLPEHVCKTREVLDQQGRKGVRSGDAATF